LFAIASNVSLSKTNVKTENIRDLFVVGLIKKCEKDTREMYLTFIGDRRFFRKL